MNNELLAVLDLLLQESLKNKDVDESYNYKIAKAKLAGKDKVKIGDKEHPVKMSLSKAQDIVNEFEDNLQKLNEKKKKKKPGNKNYYKGTAKSNKSMEKEINKCAKEPRPKSCYDYWSADKQYDKAKSNEEEEKVLKDLIKEMLTLDEKKRRKRKKSKKKKSGKLSAKTKEKLKKKAKKANMPLGALTAVYKKGLAAWLTGHRQGIPQHAWAMARVNSFIRGGKTRSVDKAEWKKVQKHRAK